MKRILSGIGTVAYSAALLTVGMFFVGTIQAKTVYVAPEGQTYSSSVVSSYDDPIKFSTMPASIPSSYFTSGDTMFFKGGVYLGLTANYNFAQTGASGSADKRTFMGAVPGETPILDFRTQAYNTGALKIQGSFFHIKGLTVRYSGKNAILVNGANNIIENCVAYGNGDTGIQAKNGNNVFLNCDSYQNFDYKSSTIGGNADGFADKQYTSPAGMANKYIGCRAWENSDDGWDFYEHISASGYPTEFDGCWCFNNGPSQFDLTDFPRYEVDKTFFDNYKTSEGKIIVPNSGNGNGFKVGGNSTKHDVILRNCVSFGNKVKGFDQNNNGGDMQIYNCTSYGNKSLNYGLGNKVSGASLTIMNCISAPQSVSNSFFSGTISQTNNWNMSLSVTDADFQSVDLARAYDIRNADGSLSDMGNLFRLSAKSKLIDKGTKLEGIDFCHKTLDLGAFEFCGTIEGGGDDSEVLVLDQTFQSWAPEGAGDCSASTSYSDTHTEGTNVKQVELLNGGNVTFTLTDYAVNPICSSKKPASQPAELTNGYISLNKVNSEATPPTAGSLVISALPKITQVFFTLSATGANRGCYLAYSTDGGNLWTKTQEALYIGSNDTQGGNAFFVDIDKEDVMLKFYTDNQIVRIHDLKIYTSSASGIGSVSQNAFDLYMTGGELYCSENVSVEIYNIAGKLIKSAKNIQNLSLQSLVPGIYVVKAANSEGKTMTQKIVK